MSAFGAGNGGISSQPDTAMRLNAIETEAAALVPMVPTDQFDDDCGDRSAVAARMLTSNGGTWILRDISPSPASSTVTETSVATRVGRTTINSLTIAEHVNLE